jgi:hypothetical protein
MASKKVKCVRCEMLERKQRSKYVYTVGGVSLCGVCVLEVKEEEEFIESLKEEDGPSEDINQ